MCSLFMDQVALTPNAPALLDDGEHSGEPVSYSYAELDSMAEKLAGTLTKAGVGLEVYLYYQSHTHL